MVLYIKIFPRIDTLSFVHRMQHSPPNALFHLISANVYPFPRVVLKVHDSWDIPFDHYLCHCFTHLIWRTFQRLSSYHLIITRFSQPKGSVHTLYVFMAWQQEKESNGSIDRTESLGYCMRKNRFSSVSARRFLQEVLSRIFSQTSLPCTRAYFWMKIFHEKRQSWFSLPFCLSFLDFNAHKK